MEPRMLTARITAPSTLILTLITPPSPFFCAEMEANAPAVILNLIVAGSTTSFCSVPPPELRYVSPATVAVPCSMTYSTW